MIKRLFAGFGGGKGEKTAFYSGRLRNRGIRRYIIAFVLYVSALVLTLIIGDALVRLRVWYSGEFLYELLSFIADNIFVFGFIGWFVISLFLVVRPYREMEKIISAAGKLAEPEDTPIELPPNLEDIENELNRVREHTLYSARLAREAEQRKDDLIVYLAHDLKTPLTSVIGYLTLLRDEPELPENLREKFINIACDKSMRLEELINEFFEIARYSSAKVSLTEGTVDLSLMLEQIMYEFNPMLLEKGLKWRKSIQKNIDFYCDADKLERLFDNLFRNAVSYSYPDSTIGVTLTADSTGVTAVITNSGKTIPPDKLSRIFEQFFRLDPSRGTASGGAGLGLAIAKEMAELHGGSISAESADETVTFTVRLPAERVRNL